MKTTPSMFAALALLATSLAQAHAHLHASTPANHATVAEAPKALAMEFTEAVKLATLTLQKDGGEASKLGPLPATAGRSVSVALPALAPGNYTVKWRALSDDGHVVADKLVFAVGAR